MPPSPAGYVTDVEYTAGFIPETAPTHIALAALCANRSPGAALDPRRFLELGFGQGFGLTLLAAANPHIVFEGCDVNPRHVAHARELVEHAGLSNVEIAEAGFEQYVDSGKAGDADVIVAHGVLSWVGAEARAALLEIVRRRLSPEGLFYISYNSLPGSASLTPIRRLMLEVARAHTGSSSERLDLALATLDGLRSANALFFAAHPVAAREVDALMTKGMDRAYLAHEYLSAEGEAYAYADVAREMHAIGLGYVASAWLPENIAALAIHDAARPLVDKERNPLLRETLKDYAVNKRFRRDIYARSPKALAPDEWRREIALLRFELVAPRSRTLFEFEGPLGKLAGKREIYAAIADRLAHGPASFAELLALPPFGGDKRDMLLECLALLVHSAQVMPIVANSTCEAAPAQRFNRVIAQRATEARIYGYLAAPAVGSGIPVNESDVKLLNAALRDDTPALDALRAENGAPVDETLALWRRLGVL